MLRRWLALGYQAGMGWMEDAAAREDPRTLLPEARSVIVAGLGYYRAAADPGPGEGRIARYALGPDYHDLIKGKLDRLLGAVRALVPCQGVVAVDKRPLLERALGRRAGIGWFGRHGGLVTERFASWLLLGELLVDIDLEPDEPRPARCGKCDRCRRACPTGAIVAPGLVDAGRCIAYLTVENRGGIPRELRGAVGEWLFGCDRCQEACPWNRFVVEAPGAPERQGGTVGAAEIVGLSERAFRSRFAGTAVLRARRAGLARNAAVVAGNRRTPAGRAALEKAAGDANPVVRGHVAWALGRYGAKPVLERWLGEERNPDVREEIRLALADPGSPA